MLIMLAVSVPNLGTRRTPMLRFRFDTPQIDGQIHPDARLVDVRHVGG